MVAFSFLFVALSLVSFSFGAPTVSDATTLQTSSGNPLSVLCGLPLIGQLLGKLCPPKQSLKSSLTVKTAIGTAQGVADSGINRFAVRYASAERWAESNVATTWSLPNNGTNPSALPLVCPQQNIDDSAFSEDCLSMLLYVPQSFTPSSSNPVFVWVHGGSFVAGSATDTGLDGSNLAVATQSIVVVPQYRLGALGMLSPNGSTNLGLKDVINALTFINKNIAAFGGDTSRVTIAGQSSGATMIRSLLAVPSASHLFQSAILQSDPMDYGFLSVTTQQTLQSAYNGLINCAASDYSCQTALSVDTILNAQVALLNESLSLDASVGTGEPLRTVNDGTLITSPLDSTAPFPSVNKPILVSTVLNEAALTIYGEFTSPIPQDEFLPICQVNLDNARAATVDNSSFYAPPAAAKDSGDSSGDARVQLQTLGTDYIWRCSSWTFARNWKTNGGSVYVGMYSVGATYPGNEAVPFCTKPGSVCHQDDIEIVFGTVPHPTSAQSALINEMQARYKEFMLTGSPNVPAYPPWYEATSSNVNALNLGGSGEVAVGSCEPSFWGESVPYDYQIFNI
ncbi:Alpha/Beta hydrolase protein [Rhodocollybia butyracea]|uniref:Carboxylic ester hydrolase n=1 Tax=Rhodocollybia butyracea TaxID=206335 RepID=A0A9P5U8E5_9AGAR|nr:Alpha/Beta hydrolase protein [Rhodocollybia butyracea]